MSRIIHLSIDVLKVHPRNIEFFDDIDGETYEMFKKSIKKDGILTPLTVAPDMTIISGHQRYKACKDLGIELVPSIIREDLTDEKDKLKTLLAANFGRLKNNPVKQGKVFAEYEKLCGVTVGRPGKSRQNVAISQEQIAGELGVDVRTIQRLKKLQTLSPELQQLIEDGTVKYTTALNVWGKLPHEDQRKLIEELGEEHLKTLTSKQTQEIIQLQQQSQEKEDRINELETKLTQAEKDKAEPEVIEKEVEVEKLIYQEVVPESIKERLKQAEERAKEAEEQMKQAGISISILEQENRELKQLEEIIKQRDTSPIKDIYVMLRSVNNRFKVLLHEMDRAGELVNVTPQNMIDDIVIQLQVMEGFREPIIAMLRGKSIDIDINSYNGNVKYIEGEILND